MIFPAIQGVLESGRYGYAGLRKKGMSKERAAKIANTPNASKKGGKKSGGGKKSS